MEINKDIIQKIQNCDRVACKKLYDAYNKVCLGICLRYARKRVDAEDMLQEGFLEVFRSIHTYSFNGSFEGWVKKVILNQVLNYVRKHYKIKEANSSNEFNEIFVENNERLEENELLLIVNSIPEKYKIIFNLHAIERFSHKEIAELLSTNENTVRSQFLRARIIIQSKLQEIDRLEKKHF